MKSVKSIDSEHEYDPISSTEAAVGVGPELLAELSVTVVDAEVLAS